MEANDAELVSRCRKGDREAWEFIVRQHHHRIYNLAYRFTGRFDEAEDLTQEVFLKVYRTLDAYRSETGALGSWMIRVARNHVIDHYRKHKTERAQTDPLGEEDATPAKLPSPARSLEQRELSERIHRALLKISEDLREAVILRDLEEMTYEEIAEIMKVPLGTVKSRINRGRMELARMLKRA